MKQQYRDIDIEKDVRMEGDEYRLAGTEDWAAISSMGMGKKYKDDSHPILKYRRPIAQQYVYENAGFEDTLAGFMSAISRMSNGDKFYDGNEFQIPFLFDSEGIKLANGTLACDLHTRKPAPRMIEFNGQQLVAPETEEPEIGTEYYYSPFEKANIYTWGGTLSDKRLFACGIWLKEEHCQAYIDATQKLLFGGDE